MAAGNGSIIKLNDVSKSYIMGTVTVDALNDVSLSINEGEFVVFLGPSGSGKTTLLNLIGGIDSATSGSIKIEGTEITTMNDKTLTSYRRDHFGYVFQFFNLIPTLTALENVEFAAELVENPRDSLEMLEIVGLKERASHYPSELSGGEQQRVAIARALVKNPPILLCDEPTGELDYETGKTILAVIRSINKKDNKTVLLVTHNTAVGEIADRVIKLRSGRFTEMEENKIPLDPQKLRW